MLRPKSALLSCFLPAPAPRIPGPATPCTTARTTPLATSSLLALTGSYAAPRFLYSCGRAVASPHSHAAHPFRSCPAQNESPRAPPTSTPSPFPAWHPPPAPQVLPTPSPP